MRFLLRALSGLFIVVITAAFIGFGAYRLVDSRQASDDRPRRVPEERSFVVNTDALEAVRTRPEITAYGEIVSWRTLLLRAPVAGEVIEIAPVFRDGTRIEKDATLFVIDPPSYRLALADARAARAEAAAERAEAEQAITFATRERDTAAGQLQLQDAERARQRKLLARGLATESDVSAAELAWASADQTWASRDQALAVAGKRVERAALAGERAHIAVEAAERNLEDTRVVAPFAGVLDAVAIELGQILSGNEQVATLVDPEALEVRFQVPNARYAHLLGDNGRPLPLPVEVTLDIGGAMRTQHGRVERVAAVVDAGGRRVYARLDVAGDSVFKPGDFVTVTVTEPPLDRVSVVPASAVTDDGRILVVGEDDRLEEHRVEILRRSGESLVVRPAEFGLRYVRERLPQLARGVRVTDAAATPVEQVAARADTNADTMALDAERRAALTAFVRDNARLPEARRTVLLEQLAAPRVPADVVARLESRMGR